MANAKYVEITSVNISPKRAIVISKTDYGMIKIGQRLSVKDENNRTMNIFLKGSIDIPLENVNDLRDSLNEVIKYLEKS